MNATDVKEQAAMTSDRRARRPPAWHSTGLALLMLSLWLGLDAQAQATDAYRFIDAPGTLLAAAQAHPKPSSSVTAQVSGTVVDGEGAVMNDADIVLLRDAPAVPQRTRTDADGRYSFAQVPLGRFKITASAQGMTSAAYSGSVQAAGVLEVPTLKLAVAAVTADVSVVVSQEELAYAELKVEEHQRLAGFLPNFFVSYDWKAAPLTTRQKFGLASKNASDPGNIVVAGLVAGVQQAQNAFPGYGQGVGGYGKRFGAAMGDLVVGTMLGGAVYPTLFHQDPRYFYKGSGSIRSRALYAITRPVVSRGDNGRWQPAYASVLGDFSAGAITNLYYPAEDRHGLGLTLEEGLLNIAGDALNDIMQEFVLRHLTPHAANYGHPENP